MKQSYCILYLLSKYTLLVMFEIREQNQERKKLNNSNKMYLEASEAFHKSSCIGYFLPSDGSFHNKARPTFRQEQCCLIL